MHGALFRHSTLCGARPHLVTTIFFVATPRDVVSLDTYTPEGSTLPASSRPSQVTWWSPAD